MKYILVRAVTFAAACIVLTATSVRAEPDPAVLAKITTQFSEKMKDLSKDLPSVTSANGTAQMLNRWSDANEAFTKDFASYLKLNAAYLQPGAQVDERIKPAFEAVLMKLSRLKEDYPTLPSGVANLMKRFSADPEVTQSLKRFQGSLDHLDEVIATVPK